MSSQVDAGFLLLDFFFFPYCFFYFLCSIFSCKARNVSTMDSGGFSLIWVDDVAWTMFTFSHVFEVVLGWLFCVVLGFWSKCFWCRLFKQRLLSFLNLCLKDVLWLVELFLFVVLNLFSWYCKCYLWLDLFLVFQGVLTCFLCFVQDWIFVSWLFNVGFQFVERCFRLLQVVHCVLRLSLKKKENLM